MRSSARLATTAHRTSLLRQGQSRALVRAPGLGTCKTSIEVAQTAAMNTIVAPNIIYTRNP